MKQLLLLFFLVIAVLTSRAVNHTFTSGNKTFLLDGQPFVVKAAELHYPRIPQPYWEHRIRMCKALGMNTICIYVFWNIHEQQEGQFNFTGQNDVAAFCRLAQEHGMYVIVRPGPYVCAEWEMGGLPWWLLKKKDILLREQDPYFMQRVRLFEEKVGEQLAPLTIGNGGPIIMIQVENEYGSYGVNKPYVAEIRDCLRKIYGQEITLFQCDWASNFENNGLDDLVWTMNFGTGANLDEQFRRLQQLRPSSPLMCSEFWSGWFDKWGANHETRPAKDMVDGIDGMLSRGISFSLYMTHGGTSFGHWAGANSPGYAPDVTSYDYDAPISESGLPTDKFWLLRKTLQNYANRPLPAVPRQPMPFIAVPQFTLSEYVPIEAGVSRTVHCQDVQTMEALDMGWGSMLYSTTLPEIPEQGILTLNDCHDYARIFIDGKFIGKIDRVKNEKSIGIPPCSMGSRLTILVEAMGRINFGRAIKDFKGITESVTIETQTAGHEMTLNLKEWDVSLIPDDYGQATAAFEKRDGQKGQHLLSGGAGYYKGTFSLSRVGDTFLSLESFGKGQVYVNGYAIGRFWHIGPQQTLYVPGCWLKKGRNEVIVLDVEGAKGSPILIGQKGPELNKLHLERSLVHNSPANMPDLNSATPVCSSAFKPGNGWQRVTFGHTARGRYLAIRAISTHDERNAVAVAELYALDAEGQRHGRDDWKVHYADSEDILQGNHTGDKAFDLQESTYWLSGRGANLPHLLVIDMGKEQPVTGIDYLPRVEEGTPASIKDYEIFIY